jgi:hypothetical protein
MAWTQRYEAVRTSETSVGFYQTTLRNVPEDTDLKLPFTFNSLSRNSPIFYLTTQSVPRIKRFSVRSASIIKAMMDALMMDAVRTSETSVYSSETTRRYIPEDCHIQNTSPLPRSISG